MKVSIAMTTYNGAKYLQEQLDSFVIQSSMPHELIVCDDGSTDSTIEILETFRQHAPFIVHIHRNEANLGFTKNFEKALSKCTGDLIFLSDQDDIWYPNKIKILEKTFECHPDKQILIHDGDLVDEHCTSQGITKLGQVISGYGNDDKFITGALTAIRSTFLPLVTPIPDGIQGHDIWIHKMARLLDTRLVLNQSLQNIRRHSSNTSNWIASSVKKINKFDVFKSQLKSPVASEYEDILLINESLQKKLNDTLECSNIFSTKAIVSGLNYLILERNAIQSRSKLLKSNFFLRRIFAVQMLLGNNYKFFNGYKSFFRDLIR